jgi:hypothetical protein
MKPTRFFWANTLTLTLADPHVSARCFPREVGRRGGSGRNLAHAGNSARRQAARPYVYASAAPRGWVMRRALRLGDRRGGAAEDRSAADRQAYF